MDWSKASKQIFVTGPTDLATFAVEIDDGVMYSAVERGGFSAGWAKRRPLGLLLARLQA